MHTPGSFELRLGIIGTIGDNYKQKIQRIDRNRAIKHAVVRVWFSLSVSVSQLRRKVNMLQSLDSAFNWFLKYPVQREVNTSFRKEESRGIDGEKVGCHSSSFFTEFTDRRDLYYLVQKFHAISVFTELLDRRDIEYCLPARNNHLEASANKLR